MPPVQQLWLGSDGSDDRFSGPESSAREPVGFGRTRTARPGSRLGIGAMIFQFFGNSSDDGRRGTGCCELACQLLKAKRWHAPDHSMLIQFHR